MSPPTTTQNYVLPQLATYTDLVLRESSLRAPKGSEVLVKIHAVSLQFRDLVIANNQYGINDLIRENLVPCSDAAGEIIAVGDDVGNLFSPGDRVCANFSADHVHGDPTPVTLASGLGGPIQGVLTKYRLFNAHTNGRGVDHVIEIGGTGTLPKSLRSIRHAGWIHVIGFVTQNTPIAEEANLVGTVIGKAAYIRGILTGSVAQFNDMNRLIVVNSLRPVIDKVFPWDSFVDAYKYLESQAHVGKVVIRVS
ncbi:hypothetical protein HGRIS_006888 [Hohenbuehelia grisea]|uniref:Enoyl reductase (ER) domain-containing protein n=1 Tax=Hohenbuehelia grisea TaxID=104357 RepID=A0ABR3JB31_9AGAR